jgi:hypothetical protein
VPSAIGSQLFDFPIDIWLHGLPELTRWQRTSGILPGWPCLMGAGQRICIARVRNQARAPISLRTARIQIRFSS